MVLEIPLEQSTDYPTENQIAGSIWNCTVLEYLGKNSLSLTEQVDDIGDVAGTNSTYYSW